MEGKCTNKKPSPKHGKY